MRSSLRPLISATLLMASVLGAPAALAGLPEALKQVKPSVLAVGTFQRTRSPSFEFRGTGFVVGDGRHLATNAHVLPTTVDEERMERLAVAVPQAGGMAQIRGATRVAVDSDHDLALLRIDGEPLVPLVLGPPGLVDEGRPIGFTGFPIGSALGLTPVTHRGIISAVTPIGIPQGNARQLKPGLIKRLADGAFMVYQLDATAYPGNSGSPLYDVGSAEVIGIINMVFIKGTKENSIADPSGITYAIPVRYLREMLERQ